ncbi:MAG: HAMP domain-containing histidine kinase [Flavobacteriia bacterium]|nr:HAMP domain-containing histidine kinase [Flavobacteriia bacterium]
MSSLYTKLNSLSALRKSYPLKFLAVAFLGIHLPVIGLIVTIQFTNLAMNPWLAVLIVIGVTLLSSVLTLFILRELTLPIRQIATDVERYKTTRKLPNWNITGSDEVSALMRLTEDALRSLENSRIRQEDLSMLLSHDLRSPIGAAIGLLEVLPQLDDQEKSERLKELQQLMRDQLAFIDVVLAIQKHENISAFDELKDVSILESVKQVVESHQPSLKNKNLNISVSVQDEFIRANKNMLRQALTNLLSNAVKYTPGGGHIQINGQLTYGNQYVLTIEDSGIGMSKETLNKLFNRSFDEHISGTRGESSMGLGLYLTKTLLSNQGATVKAESEGDGKGSKFIVQFKLA